MPKYRITICQNEGHTKGMWCFAPIDLRKKYYKCNHCQGFHMVKQGVIKWINPKFRKPEGNVFWALTEGRSEQGIRDWVIRKLLNNKSGDYRTLDYSESFGLPDTSIGRLRDSTIFAWLPIDAIPIKDEEFD